MTSARGRRSWLRRLAGGLGALAVAEVVIAGGFTLGVGWSWADALEAFGATNATIGVAFAVCGAIIAWHRPRNPIGWLFAADGLGHATAAFAPPVVQALQDGGGPLGLQRTLTTLFVYSWPWSIGLFLPLALLLFPDGRPPSPRWRPVVIAVVVTAPLFVLEMGAAPQPAGPSLPVGYLTIPGYEALQPLWALSELRTIGAIVVAIAALLFRYRRATAVQRRQLLLLLLATIAAVAFMVPWSFVAGTPVAVLFVIPLIPAAVTVAILRHRLFDIDVVIKKTVVFGALAAFITVAYVAIVVGVGNLLGSSDEPNLGLSVLATALVAVAFQPVRERVQHLANRLVYGRRASPYEVLAEFSEQVAETHATEDVLPRMARTIKEGVGAERAEVWLRSGGWLRPAASDPPDVAPAAGPIPLDDGTLPSFEGVDRAIEVRHQGQLLGALTVTKPPAEPLTPAEDKLLADLAAQAGLVLRNVGLAAELLARLDELQESRKRLVAAQDQERRRIERDLHDGAQQYLVALKTRLNLAKKLGERDPNQAVGLIAGLEDLAGETLDTLRDLARGIYPPLLADQGLQAALAAQARKATIPIEITDEGISRYSQEIESAAYFCCLEALQNAAKYAQSSHVVVSLAEEAGALIFSVQDDGAGFDPATTPKGSGIHNMTDRLEALGGTLTITSTPGHGTTITGRIPGQPR